MSLPTATNRDLLTLAREQGLLTPETASSLAEEAARRGATAEQLLLQKGLLSPVQFDILHTLSRPREAVPGYEVLSVIGHGGMGVVYRARQLTLNRVVALKTMLVSQMGEAAVVARFEQEAQTVARLQHPNIIAAYDFGRHEGRLFFAMELVEGEDLEQLIRRDGRLDEATAWGLTRQVAAGLTQAAQLGVVHRDIKPANLLLVNPPEGFPLPAGLPLVKIADFGLAYLSQEAETRSRLTNANVAVGSPHYMAPEQLSGQAVDFRADMYSLGATVYHMLAGEPPFQGNLSQIIAQKLRGEPPDLRRHCPHASPEAAALVACLLQVNAAERPRDYPEILARIDALIALSSGSNRFVGDKRGSTSLREPLATTQVFAKGETAVEGPTTRLKRTTPELFSRRLLLAAAGVGLAASAGVVGMRLGRRPRPRPDDDLAESGWSSYLFRESLDGWQPVFGEWADGKDNEQAKVIAGKDGQLRRSLRPEESSLGKALTYYRLTLQVCPHFARATEVHFAIQAKPESPRTVLRITRDGVLLARRASDRGKLEPLTTAVPLVFDDERYYAIRIERRRTGWRAYFEEQLIGGVRSDRLPYVPEIRLAVEGGPAWFSDVELAELAPAAKS